MIFNAEYQIVCINSIFYLGLRVALFVFKPVQISIMLIGDRISMFVTLCQVWKQKLYLCMHEDTNTCT